MRAIVFVFIVAIIAILIFPGLFSKEHRQAMAEHRLLSDAHSSLEKLIEAEDAHYQARGKYLPVMPGATGANSRAILKWCIDGCPPCEFAVTTGKGGFSASAKCPVSDGQFDYLGYVRTAPGAQTGIDDFFGKCIAAGIYAGSRHLVNTIGPCFDQKSGILTVAAGRLKRLVVVSYTGGANIRANGATIGQTSSQHNVISPSYGSFFWENPLPIPMTIRIEKSGYEPVQFNLDWSSSTYRSAIVLRPASHG